MAMTEEEVRKQLEEYEWDSEYGKRFKAFLAEPQPETVEEK